MFHHSNQDPRSGKDDGATWLALLLAGLAGWVDAAGLGGSSGVFLSFMSGNTTDLAASLAHQNWARAETIAAVIVLFVAGVTVGELLQQWIARPAQPLILAFESLALGIGAAFYLPDSAVPAFISIWPLVFAMGLQNTTMHRVGGINVGLTYVTGTLVQIGRGLAGGGNRRKLAEYVALWLSLATGAGFGAMALTISPVAAVSAAAGAAAIFALLTALTRG